MLWQISSASLDVIIEASKTNLDEKIMETIEANNPDSLGVVILARRLTGWNDGTTIQEIEESDLYWGTVGFLRKFGKFKD